MKTAALLAALWVSANLSAQVAGQANAGYRTEQQRQAVARGLGDPHRDAIQRPSELVRTMGISKGMAVADVGTGIGYMLPFLSRAVGPEGKIIAEDIFDDFLAAARERAQSQHLENITFLKGTTDDPGLPEGQLDTVLALDVYHHFDYPEKMLAAIHKALKPGGKLIIVEYYKRPGAMANGMAMTHIRLDMPDVIKEVEANHFHLVMEKETIRNSQYLLMLDKN